MQFRPKPIVTLAALIGIALLCALGTWQLSRFLEKQAIEEVQAKNVEKAAVRVNALADLEGLDYQRVQVSGKLDRSRTVLFKHRTYNRRPGYWLVQPLTLQDQSVLLVNRGWVPFEQGAAFAAKETKKKNLEEATLSVTGLFYVLPQNLKDSKMRASLQGKEDPLKSSVTQWDRYDIQGVYDALPGKHLDVPGVLVQEKAPAVSEKAQEESFPLSSTRYVTKPYMTSERHMSYFIFWYTCAGALLGLYLAASFGVIGSFGQQRQS